jgi:hypothetical protein
MLIATINMGYLQCMAEGNDMRPLYKPKSPI